MFQIRLPNGIEMVFPSVEEFQAAVASGVVTSDSEIFHQKAERWVPIASHPTYHRAVSAARAPAAAPLATVAPAAAPAAPPIRRVVPVAPAVQATAPRPVVAARPPAPPQVSPRPAVMPPMPHSAQRPAAAPTMAPPAVSAQRPAIVIPAPAPLPVAAAPARAVLRPTPPPVPSAPPMPAPPSRPAPPTRSNELRSVDLDLPETEPTRPVSPLPASSPIHIAHSAPAPAIVVPPPARAETLADLTAEFEILEGFGTEDSAATTELPVRAPAPRAEPVHHAPTPAVSARPSRPDSVHQHEPVAHLAPESRHVPVPAPAPSRSGSGRWLIAAALGAALIGGGALVAWRSGGAKPAAVQLASTATTSAYTQVPRPESTPAMTPSGPGPTSTTPTYVAPVATPPAAQKPVQQVATPPVATAPVHQTAAAPVPEIDSAPILPGRPQALSVDLDVSGAAVGTTADGGAAAISGPSLGSVTDHYADAASDAGKQLEARLSGIGFSRVIAPLRFGSVESMEGARHTISSAVGMVAAFRTRMQALEKIYGDSAAQAQRGRKASPKEMMAWDHRLPQRESAEAAQAVDLALSKSDQLYAALLAHPEQVKVDVSSVSISDPELARQYQSLRQWLGQRFDTWTGTPFDAVPPTVRQTMKAFSDALTH